METEVKKSFRSGFSKGVGFGLLLILIGSIFLGIKTGFIPGQLESVIISWPMLLILIGFGNLLKRHWISGIIFLVLGKFFLVPKIIEAYPEILPGLNTDFANIYWPLLFIVAGILIILHRFIYPQSGVGKFENKWKNQQNYHHQYHHKDYSKWNASENGFSKSSVFGSGDHIVLDPEFKGGDMNAVFGGMTLDLRRTSLPDGETHLEINAIFGGIIIYVPEDWYADIHIDTVFGGFQDNRLPKDPLDTTKKLVITGSCVFGSGELRN